MKTLLQINSSLHSSEGQSSALAAEFAERWLRANPDGRVVVRDLAATPPAHLTAERFKAFQVPPAERTDEQKAFVAESDELIAELRDADAVAIGLPMYNFGIPSTLKAWIDQVARAGQTFKYTDRGPVGLLADRPVWLFAARGGFYRNTPRDTQSAYITHFLNFIGIRTIEFVYAEGLATGVDARNQSLHNARENIERLAA